MTHRLFSENTTGEGGAGNITLAVTGLGVAGPGGGLLVGRSSSDGIATLSGSRVNNNRTGAGGPGCCYVSQIATFADFRSRGRFQNVVNRYLFSSLFNRS